MAQLKPFDVLAALATAEPRRARSPVALRLRARALALAQEEQLVQALGIYRFVPLQGTGRTGRLCLDGRELAAPWLIPASGTLTAVACGVASIGPQLESRATALFAQGQRSLGVALDELGNEALFIVSRRLQDRMLADARQQGLTMAGELRAGDPGLALESQQTVVQLADAQAIGIRLSSASMMYPVKSTSMVQGVGLALPAARWSRCDTCPNQARCKVAQDAQAAL